MTSTVHVYNIYEVLANLDSIWVCKSCRKLELPDLNSMIMWTLFITIPAKHAYASALLYSCCPLPDVIMIIRRCKSNNLSPLERKLGCRPFCNYAHSLYVLNEVK